MDVKHKKTLCQCMVFGMLLFYVFNVAATEELKLPWTVEAIKKALTVGTIVVYTMEGTDKRGNPRNGTFHYEITKADDAEIYLESRKEGANFTGTRR